MARTVPTTANHSLPIGTLGLYELQQSFKAAMAIIDAAVPVGALLLGDATYNPADLADGDGATTTVEVVGAELGDFVEAVSFDKDLQGILLTAWVSDDDEVSVRFQNETDGSVNLASGQIYVRVRKNTNLV